MSTAKFDTWMNPDGTTNYKCRAWVNFDGTTSPGTIRASGNVSSVTRNATGDYTVNFTTAMPDANYSIAGAAGSFATLYGTVQLYNPAGTLPSTTSFRFQTAGSNWVATNLANVNISVFR